MAHSSWGPGWPNCQPSKIDSSFSVDGTKFPGGMRYELVDLTTMLVRETKARGYRFGTSSDPSYGCWGYSCRAISGSNNPSNHSWGLAVDINAPSNPYTSPLVTDMPGWMPDLWNAYGFRWGGDYSGSKDAMHYEFMESVSAAASYTEKARAAGLGGGSAPTPTPEPEIDMSSTATVLIDGNPNVFAVASDGKIYQQWPDPNKPGGWSGWSAGVPGDWAGGLSVVAMPLPQIWGVAADGKTFQTTWSSGDKWNGPVAWTGIESI